MATFTARQTNRDRLGAGLVRRLAATAGELWTHDERYRGLPGRSASSDARPALFRVWG